jgi:hypothetical protein
MTGAVACRETHWITGRDAAVDAVVDAMEFMQNTAKQQQQIHKLESFTPWSVD